tara:strand:- start:111 stop:308 length:198 start_codon:yes stop_codon:yes gene_type:complete
MIEPEDFDPKHFDVRWDDHYDDYSVKRLSDGAIFAVTPHALAVLRDEDYRMAVFATQAHIRSQLH